MRSALLATALLAGCSANLPLDTTTLVTCASDAECPDGLVCVNAERCVRPRDLESDGVTLATPAADALVAADAPVVFTWSTVAGALRYRLTVTTIPQGDVVIDEIVPTTSFSQMLSAGTYAWTVVSDITDATGPVQRFGVTDDAVYVYCGDGDCNATADELGTAALPFHAISRGARRALSAGVATVRVAKRPHDAAYAEEVDVLPGLTFAGGYAPDFATRDGLTNVALADTSLYASFVDVPSGVEHFKFTNTRADTKSTVAAFYRCSAALVLTDVTLDAPGWSTNVLRVNERTDDVGPQFVDSTITGTFPSSGPQPGTLRLILLEDAALTLRNTTLHGSTARAIDFKQNGLLNAVDASSSILTTDHAVFDLESNAVIADVVGFTGTTSKLDATATQITVNAPYSVRATGIQFTDTQGTATLTGGSIDVTTTGSAAAVNLNDYSSLTATRARLSATSTGGIPQTARGVVAGKLAVVTLHASLVTAACTWLTTGLYLSSEARGVIASSTIVVIEGEQQAIYADTPLASFVNNALIGLSTSTSTHRAGLVITGSAAYAELGAVVNNRFINFPNVPGKTCGYARDASYGTCADPNAATSGDPRPYLAGNALVTATDAKLDQDHRPSATSPLAHSGIDPMSDICRQIVTPPSLPNGGLPAPSCGGTVLDIDGQPFETPMPTIGYLRAAQ